MDDWIFCAVKVREENKSMERRTRRRAFARNVYSAQKRLLAFLLAAAMILTNVGSDLSVAFAGTSESVVRCV